MHRLLMSLHLVEELDHDSFGRVRLVPVGLVELAVVHVVRDPAFNVSDAAFQQLLSRVAVVVLGQHHGQTNGQRPGLA